jgi:hypothetical protein
MTITKLSLFHLNQVWVSSLCGFLYLYYSTGFWL